MLKSKFPLSQSSRNDNELVLKCLDTKTVSPCNYANRRSKNDLDTENKQQSIFKCVLLDFDSNLGREGSLKRAFSLS